MVSSPQPSGEAETQKTPGKWPPLLAGHRINLYLLLVSLPGILVSGILIWLQPWSKESKLALSLAELLVWWVLAVALREQAVRPLQTLTNVVAALREGDYSARARGAIADNALGELSLEVNALADVLADQRLGALEASALLRRVVEEIESPLFAFDPNRVLRLVNPAGEKLLQQAAIRILGRTAEEIGLADCLTVANEALVALPTHSSSVRWLVRQSKFREKGVPHTLVVLSDVSRALREEERSAWQRLIRVVGHELNNSLAPIKSIAGSLGSRLAEIELSPAHRRDFERGLAIIEDRTGALNRFLQAYRRLAQMPPPTIKKVALLPIVERVALLETRLAVAISRGPNVTLLVDGDQIEQMLINLLRNGVEAALESVPRHELAGNCLSRTDICKPEVTLSWRVEDDNIVLTIDDNGPGLLNPSNVFVPFYTTKPAGSGIGLALSRQIAEVHGGSIELSNLEGRRGCRARVILPRIQETCHADP